jgi:hypothetical protein
MVRFLVKRHPDFHCKDKSNMTALLHACEHGHFNIVRGIYSFIMYDRWKLREKKKPRERKEERKSKPHADRRDIRDRKDRHDRKKRFDDMLQTYTIFDHETTKGLEQEVDRDKSCWYRCGNTAVHAAAHSGNINLGEFLEDHGGYSFNAHGQSAKDILRWKEKQSAPGSDRSRRLDRIGQM